MNFKSVAAALACGCLISMAHAADTIKIAHIAPMSGPFGLVGESFGRHLDAAAGAINAKGGVQFEIVNFDNK